MGPTPFPLPQASGYTLTAHSGQNTRKEKQERKANGEILPKHSVVFIDPYAKGNTSSGCATVTVHRGS